MNALIEDDCVRAERFQGGCLTRKMEIGGGFADKHRKLTAAEVFRGDSGLEHNFRSCLLKFRDKLAFFSSVQSPQHRRPLHVFIASRVSCVEQIMISVNILDVSWKRQHSKWVERWAKGFTALPCTTLFNHNLMSSQGCSYKIKS